MMKYPNPLPPYKLPAFIKGALRTHNMDPFAVNAYLRKVLYVPAGVPFPLPTCSRVVKSTFQNALYCEEVQKILDMCDYDIEAVEMEVVSLGRDARCRLFVPGLAEKRPSLLRGDAVSAMPSNPDGTFLNTVKFKGFIHEVHLDNVIISFDCGITNWRTYNVRFNLSRTIERIMLRALEDTGLLHQLWFDPPLVTPLDPPPPFPELTNPLNDRQEFFAKTVTQSKTGVHVLWGPPGTGKTHTITEAIAAICHAQPRAKVLLCAPSNAAADLLCDRLLSALNDNDLGRVRVLRLVAFMRDPKTVTPASLLNHSNIVGNVFPCPLESELRRYDVIVCTCINAGVILSMGVEPGRHFTHVFVDECCHALQTEMLVPLQLGACLGGAESNEAAVVVLAGDPKQLGPIVRSPLAVDFCLGVSVLERLLGLEEPPFTRSAPLQNVFCVRLEETYRAHEAITSLYSRMFYEDTLRANGSREVKDSMLWVPTLPCPTVPIVFQNIDGLESRYEDSPSWLNEAQAQAVVWYVRDLLDGAANQGDRLLAGEIGVIAPYLAQCKLIRTKLRAENITEVTVGTVENFQGQERRVILISTVRAQDAHLPFDKKFSLGFMSSPKRLNVAISRARALLVIFGYAPLLCKDDHWRALLRHIHELGAYVGPVEALADPVEALVDPVEALVDPVEALAGPVEALADPVEALAGPGQGGGVGGDDEEDYVRVDAPWRVDHE